MYLYPACLVHSDLRIVDTSRLLVHSEAFELVVYQRAVMEQIEHARNVLVSKYVRHMYMQYMCHKLLCMCTYVCMWHIHYIGTGKLRRIKRFGG